MSPGELGAAVAGVLGGAVAQGATGIGFSLVLVPVLVVALGTAQAVRLADLLAVAVNLAMLVRERRAADLGAAAALLVPAVVATVPAGWLVRHADGDALSVVAGTLILGAAAALARGVRLHGLRGARGAVAAGAVSGAMNTISGVGGPAAAIYGVNAGWSLGVLRPTLQAYFLVINVASVVVLGPPRVGAGVVVGLLAVVPVGLVVGAALGARHGARTLRAAVLAMAAVGGVVAIVRGLM